LHRIGLLDKETMREFDASCLTPVKPLSPRQIVALRRREGVSQGVLAHYLNVRPKPVKRVGARRKEAERPLVLAAA
jgi:putative transcriptional regulator